MGCNCECGWLIMKIAPSKRIVFISLASLISAFLLIAYFSFAVFLIRPNGLIPKGGAFVFQKFGRDKFIDSPESFCIRKMGAVSPLCMIGVLGAVAESYTKSSISFYLPYSELLHQASMQ